MVAGILVVLLTALLFAYWFRYTCILILSARTVRNYSRLVAEANGLTFLHSRTVLNELDRPRLDAVRQSLDRDFALVTYLLKHGGGFSVAGHSFDHFMLRLDYRLLSLWYQVVRTLSTGLARQSLLEMTNVISHLANAMGERVAIVART